MEGQEEEEKINQWWEENGQRCIEEWKNYYLTELERIQANIESPPENKESNDEDMNLAEMSSINNDNIARGDSETVPIEDDQSQISVEEPSLPAPLSTNPNDSQSDVDAAPEDTNNSQSNVVATVAVSSSQLQEQAQSSAPPQLEQQVQSSNTSDMSISSQDDTDKEKDKQDSVHSKSQSVVPIANDESTNDNTNDNTNSNTNVVVISNPVSRGQFPFVEAKEAGIYNLNNEHIEFRQHTAKINQTKLCWQQGRLHFLDQWSEEHQMYDLFSDRKSAIMGITGRDSEATAGATIYFRSSKTGERTPYVLTTIGSLSSDMAGAGTWTVYGKDDDTKARNEVASYNFSNANVARMFVYLNYYNV